jgi:integrase
VLRTCRHDLERHDCEAAGIYETPEGKAVFHSLRKSYTTLLQELAGASLVEAQKLSRNSTPMLTSNTYTKTSGARLASLVDSLAARLLA